VFDSGDEYTEGYMMLGDVPSFKIYDASEEMYHDAMPSEIYPWENFGLFMMDNLNVSADCNGDLGGSAYLDNCNICVEGNSGILPCIQDCAGAWGGDALIDNCNICDSDSSNNCVQDCAGNWGGLDNIPNSGDEAVYDECGVCGGDGIDEGACDCDGNVEDCFGECGGSALEDECGECGGDGIDEGACDCDGNVEDCFGECGGSAIEDECGVCGGAGNCDGIPEEFLFNQSTSQAFYYPGNIEDIYGYPIDELLRMYSHHL
jgi:hypothetical protein